MGGVEIECIRRAEIFDSLSHVSVCVCAGFIGHVRAYGDIARRTRRMMREISGLLRRFMTPRNDFWVAGDGCVGLRV